MFQKVHRQDRRFGKNWLGHKFTRSDQTVHELRCWICGIWFNYSTKDYDSLVQKGMWDFQKERPKHCGDDHCMEWNRRYEAHRSKVMQESNEYYVDLFRKVKNKGLVA